MSKNEKPAEGEQHQEQSKGFEPPKSQEDLDKIINGAVARAHKQYEGFDDFKAKAEKLDQLTAGDIDPVEEAREQGRSELRAELAQERVKTTFERALQGRAISPNALLGFDRSKFVKGDSADSDAITAWVEENSTPVKTTSGEIPFSGQRDPKTGDRGTVDSGRSLYQQRRKSK